MTQEKSAEKQRIGLEYIKINLNKRTFLTEYQAEWVDFHGVLTQSQFFFTATDAPTHIRSTEWNIWLNNNQKNHKLQHITKRSGTRKRIAFSSLFKMFTNKTVGVFVRFIWLPLWLLLSCDCFCYRLNFVWWFYAATLFQVFLLLSHSHNMFKFTPVTFTSQVPNFHLYCVKLKTLDTVWPQWPLVSA